MSTIIQDNMTGIAIVLACHAPLAWKTVVWIRFASRLEPKLELEACQKAAHGAQGRQRVLGFPWRSTCASTLKRVSSAYQRGDLF